MNELKTALENTMNRQIAEYEKDLEDYEFSRRFERKINRLIKSMSGGRLVFYGRSIPLKKLVQAALLVVILAVLATAAYAAISWSSFRVDSYDIYSLVKKTDIANAPLTLEERYEIGADLSGYSSEIIVEEDCAVNIFYTNKYNTDKSFEFMQMTKNLLQSMRINTEDALNEPASIEVNGEAGVLLQYKDGTYFILWDNGDYFIEITASKEFGQDELISICNSVQKEE